VFNYYTQITVLNLLFHCPIPSNMCNTAWRFHKARSLEEIYVRTLLKHKVKNR
jgi:hypothetical protein